MSIPSGIFSGKYLSGRLNDDAGKRARTFTVSQWILNPSRLPIPPYPHFLICFIIAYLPFHVKSICFLFVKIAFTEPKVLSR